MNDNNVDNKSFYELIVDNKIYIPIIQRDYAQGRIENRDICLSFLRAIRESLIEDCAINLDFVYGNIDGDIFYPLDGQQRLTTLFLLHWYAFAKEKANDTKVQKNLLRFSYETRASSRHFCEALVNNPIQINKDKDISDTIMDSQWFFLSWEKDPSIKAMLNSLDYIHSLFFDMPEIWEKLVKKKLVTFHLLILENFGLSDDLYIKMNARGRVLTPFENLKAEIQDKAEKNGWEDYKSIEEKFASKIDGEWTDFVWSGFQKDNSIDEPHMNFITTATLFKVALGSAFKGSERIEIIQKLNENNADRNLINYIEKDVFDYIYNCYELYSKLISEKAIPDLSLVLWMHTPEQNLLYQILKGNNTSYTHRVLFYAQTEFLLKNPNVDENKYLDWMRVVRNIVSRADITKEGKRPNIIRSPESFYGVLNLISELSEGSGDIYRYLCTHSLESTFAKEQLNEEIIKAQIFGKYPEQKKLIFETEDNESLHGKIMFPLCCAGFTSTIEEINFDTLAKVKNVFQNYFNRDLDKGSSDEFDLLRRAMMTISVNGEYRFYDYWHSYWIAGQAKKRRLFVIFREIEYFIGDKIYNEYFKKIVYLLMDQSYQDIIDNFTKPDNMENWQYRLIKEPELLKNCKSKYIAISEDRSCCYLLQSKRPLSIEKSTMVE